MSGQIKQRHKRNMSGVEDSKDFARTVKAVGRMAAKAAVSEAKALRIPLTYLEGKTIIRKHPGGHVEVIAEISNAKPTINLKKGTVLHARKS